MQGRRGEFRVIRCRICRASRYQDRVGIIPDRRNYAGVIVTTLLRQYDSPQHEVIGYERNTGSAVVFGKHLFGGAFLDYCGYGVYRRSQIDYRAGSAVYPCHKRKVIRRVRILRFLQFEFYGMHSAVEYISVIDRIFDNLLVGTRAVNQLYLVIESRPEPDEQCFRIGKRRSVYQDIDHGGTFVGGKFGTKFEISYIVWRCNGVVVLFCAGVDPFIIRQFVAFAAYLEFRIFCHHAFGFKEAHGQDSISVLGAVIQYPGIVQRKFRRIGRRERECKRIVYRAVHRNFV